MDPYHVTKQIIIKCTKKWYQEECNKKNVEKIENKELEKLINQLYDDKMTSLKKRIKKGILELCEKSSYNGEEGINNIIKEIFNDDDFCKKRIKTEIELYNASM